MSEHKHTLLCSNASIELRSHSGRAGDMPIERHNTRSKTDNENKYESSRHKIYLSGCRMYLSGHKMHLSSHKMYLSGCRMYLSGCRIYLFGCQIHLSRCNYALGCLDLQWRITSAACVYLL